MAEALSAGARRVQEALGAQGYPYQVVELPRSTRTSMEAAAAIGCGVEQIAKSLVFRCRDSGKPILVVASGTNRVNEKKMATLVSEAIERPGADFVRQRTGFPIGGVPPIGHTERLETFIDEELLAHQQIWAAAGNPNAVFALSPGDLVTMTGGRVISVK